MPARASGPAGDLVGHRLELRVVAHAGAAAGRAQLDQHGQRQALFAEVGAQVGGIGRRIDDAEIGEVRILAQDAGDDGHVGAAHQLVGHQHAADAVVVRGLHLGRVRQRDTPGAAVDLALEQGRAHGGLAVRRQLDAVGFHEALHPLQVVAHAGFVQHGGRQADVLGQQIPAQVRHAGGGTGSREGAEAFAVHVQGLRGRRRCSWRWRVLVGSLGKYLREIRFSLS